MDVTPDMLLRAYAAGIFPMAESAESPVLRWIQPHRRGVMPLDRFHVPRSLRKTVRRGVFSITADRAFDVLRRVSHNSNRKLTALASELVATGDLLGLDGNEGDRG